LKLFYRIFIKNMTWADKILLPPLLQVYHKDVASAITTCFQLAWIIDYKSKPLHNPRLITITLSGEIVKDDMLVYMKNTEYKVENIKNEEDLRVNHVFWMIVNGNLQLGFDIDSWYHNIRIIICYDNDIIPALLPRDISKFWELPFIVIKSVLDGDCKK
jgi:hypothetical protein